MRVIAGKYKRRNLKGPKHEGLRPTADRVKEALFNIIGVKVDGADLLDLFAGTGSIGIEALSRGANSVVFSDSNAASIKILRENLTILDPNEQVRVIPFPAERTLELLSKEGTRFDLIFLDPPFQAGLLPKTIDSIVAKKLLKNDGILAVEHPKQISVSHSELNLYLGRNYGDINLSFFQKIN